MRRSKGGRPARLHGSDFRVRSEPCSFPNRKQRKEAARLEREGRMRCAPGRMDALDAVVVENKGARFAVQRDANTRRVWSRKGRVVKLTDGATGETVVLRLEPAPRWENCQFTHLRDKVRHDPGRTVVTQRVNTGQNALLSLKKQVWDQFAPVSYVNNDTRHTLATLTSYLEGILSESEVGDVIRQFRYAHEEWRKRK